MNEAFMAELLAARRARTPCALVTVVETKGSVPRAAGSKMLVYANGRVSGTIGGGKFESLVVSEAQKQMSARQPLLKTYYLHENSAESFGAICGGESTVFIEPQVSGEAIFLIGAGHCASAIARLAIECGLFVTVVDDRKDLLSEFPSQIVTISDVTPSDFITSRKWQANEAIVLVSRNYQIDQSALAAAVSVNGAGYIGMIGSNTKVKRVFEELLRSGISREDVRKVYAPIGLDIGADAPAEIAISIVAEILGVLRNRMANHLRLNASDQGD